MNVYEMHDQALGMLISQHDRYWPQAKQSGFRSEIFGETERVKIARAIEKLSLANHPVNAATINQETNGSCGGLIARLVRFAPLEVNIGFFVSQISTWHRLKNMVLDFSQVLNEITTSSVSSPVAPVISRIKELSAVADTLSLSTDVTADMPEILDEFYEEIINRAEIYSTGKKIGWSTGIQTIDEMTSGLVGGRFYIIAARTSIGKTTFAMYMCLEALKKGAYPLFFSNEMPARDLIEKAVSAEGRIKNTKLQLGNIQGDADLERIAIATEKLKALKLGINTTNGRDLDQLLAEVYARHRRGMCDMVFIDYLQQVKVRRAENKIEQVGVVSDAMKKLAHDLKIPVIGMAQINRDSEKTGRPPSRANLKDSGSLEQDADVVMILHKEDRDAEEVDLNVAKNRYGRTGVVKMRHIQNYSTYEG